MKKKQSVAVVVPRPGEVLTPDEEISLLHLEHYLSEADRFFLLPKSASVRRNGFEVVKFEDDVFASRHSYDRFMLTSSLYETFRDYEYILVYQLDCLVFSDWVSHFCELGYDYIGAPWVRRRGVDRLELDRVGNGGLSLRRTDAFLSVLGSSGYVSESVSLLGMLFTAHLPDMYDRPNLNLFQRHSRRIQELRKIRQGVDKYLASYSRQEDCFWSDRAAFFHTGFRVATVDVGLQFAFEQHPKFCFETNGGRLPFGAHAWQKWDRAFWEPYLQV